MKYRKWKWFNKGKLEFEGEYFIDNEFKGKKKEYDDSNELQGEYEYSLGKKMEKQMNISKEEI